MSSRNIEDQKSDLSNITLRGKVEMEMVLLDGERFNFQISNKVDEYSTINFRQSTFKFRRCDFNIRLKSRNNSIEDKNNTDNQTT